MDRGGIGARRSALALVLEGSLRLGRFSPDISDLGKWEGHSFMLHVTCDLCGKELCPGHDQRFVVKVEVFAAHEPAKITEADLDDDHMEAVSELLREMEENEDPDQVEPAYRHFRYDLCPECHKRFLRDPLGKEGAQKFDFSKN
jgi:hypothetical protein